MRYITALIGALLVALVVYMAAMFVLRGVSDGLDTIGQFVAYGVAGVVAITAGAGSFRASIRRG